MSHFPCFPVLCSKIWSETEQSGQMIDSEGLNPVLKSVLCGLAGMDPVSLEIEIKEVCSSVNTLLVAWQVIPDPEVREAVCQWQD